MRVDYDDVVNLVRNGANVNAQTRVLRYLEPNDFDEALIVDGDQPIIMTPIKYALLNATPEKLAMGSQIVRFLFQHGADRNEAQEFYNFILAYFRGALPPLFINVRRYQETYGPILNEVNQNAPRRQDGGKRYRRKSVKRASKKRSTRRRHRRSV